MAFGLGGGVSRADGSFDSEIDELSETFGLKEGTTKTTNSGRVDTALNTSNGYTTNSGSTNINLTDGTTNTSTNTGTTTTGGSTNSSSTSGTKSLTTNSGSTSTTANSGRTDTSQLMISQEGIDNIIKGILEGTQGLAATSKGANVSGGYNSTTSMMLANDLLARTAGQVAERTAKQVNTIGGSTSTTTNSGSTSLTETSGSETMQNIGGTTTTQTGALTQNIGATKGTQIIGSSSTNTNNSTDTVSIIGGSTSTADTIDRLSSKTATSRDETRDTKETTKEAKAGWILCTELYKQNRMPSRFYIYGSREFASYSEQSKRGYYYWAIPALKHLRTHPYSLLSRFLCVMLNARAEHLSAEAGCSTASKSVLGFIAKNMYWGCWILSRTVARNYSVQESRELPTQGVSDV